MDGSVVIGPTRISLGESGEWMANFFKRVTNGCGFEKILRLGYKDNHEFTETGLFARSSHKACEKFVVGACCGSAAPRNKSRAADVPSLAAALAERRTWEPSCPTLYSLD
jgi:hypothetical protein